MWNILTRDGLYCSYLKWIWQVQRNIIKTRTSIYWITKWDIIGLENLSYSFTFTIKDYLCKKEIEVMIRLGKKKRFFLRLCWLCFLISLSFYLDYLVISFSLHIVRLHSIIYFHTCVHTHTHTHIYIYIYNIVLHYYYIYIYIKYCLALFFVTRLNIQARTTHVIIF